MFKYLGQHIFDFVSKFRNKVYFENLKGSSGILNVTDDGEVTKAPTINDVNTWHLSDTNILDLNPPEANPTGITFKPDGTKMFTIGYSRNRVQMYDLSTAWDITSASSPTESEYLVQGGLSSTQEDFFIDSSGTRMYVLSRSSDSVGQFTLNTAWDISDITFVQDIHVNSTSDGGFVTGEPDPAGITFKPDGTIMYIVGYNQDEVQQIPLSTAWDISTHGTITSISISPANSSQGIQFSVNGKEMYILDYSLDGIAHFTLSTAWDVTTANLTDYSVAFIRTNEATPTGLFYREDLGKCFIVGRSSDFAREVIANDVFSFNEGITASVIYAPQVIADRLTTGGGGGSNNFYNPTYAHSTFQSNSTTYLGYATSAPLIRFGNSVQQNTRIQVSRFTYLGTETINDPLRVPRFQIFPPLVGAKSKVQFGIFEEDTSYLIGGTMDIESEADTFDHKGEITLGGELKVSGNQPLKYKDPNLYTQGTQIVLDNFNETTQTTLDNHTPDTGSGYTNVYISSGISFPTHLPIIEANNGFLRPALNNSNDGYRFVNDTTISTANYEARAVIKRQHGGDDPFVLFVKYIDEDNYFAMSFGNAYSYCTPISVVNGVHSGHGYMYYHANTSTADNENIEVALRVVGNNVHLFYEGLYRGSREINITGAGKAGIGFGKMNNSQFTSYDLGQNNNISKFEIYELPDSLFGGSNSVHYIENGKLGIGTTSPLHPLHVNGNIQQQGTTNSIYMIDGGEIRGTSNVTLRSLGTFIALQSSGSLFFQAADTERMRIDATTGNVGIGTTSPVGILHTYSTSAPVIESPSNAAMVIRRNDNVGYSSLLKYHSGNSEKFVAGLSDSGDFTNSTGEEYFIGTTKTNPLVVLKNDGKLGIGVTDPERILDVGNTMMVRHATNANRKLVIGWGSMYPLSDTDEFQFLNGGAANSGMRFYGRSHSSSASKGNLFSSTGLMIGKALTDLPDANTHVTIGGADTDTILLKVRNYSNANIFSVLGSGNVGIGTTSPDHLLHVSGNAKMSNIYLLGNIIHEGDVDTQIKFATDTIAFDTAGSERLTINSTGNVGIGTTSPSEKLEVSGNIKTTGNVTFDGGAGTLDGLRTINRTGEIRINTTQGTRFGETALSVGGIVDIVGKYDKIPLGIKQEAGTTQNKLATFKDSSGNEVLAITTNGGFETLDSNLVKRFEFGHAYFPSPVDGMGIGLDLKTENASGVVVSVGNIDVIQDDVSADLSSMRLNVGETTPTEIMRLESGGNVGIGTTAPSEKLEVSGNIKASGTIKGKMEQMFACSFSDDLGTTKHYLSFTSNAEQTNVHADQAAMVMPYNGRVKSIQLRLSNIDADTIRTFGIETIAPGINMYASSNNWTIEETEAYELAATDDFYLVNYVFSNTSHFESGDLLAISIQDTEDAYTASRQTYVNVIIEYDLNNGMGNDTATTKYTS